MKVRKPEVPRDGKRDERGVRSYYELVELYGFDKAHRDERNSAIAREFLDGSWWRHEAEEAKRRWQAR